MAIWTAILIVGICLGALGFWTIYMKKKKSRKIKIIKETPH